MADQAISRYIEQGGVTVRYRTEFGRLSRVQIAAVWLRRLMLHPTLSCARWLFES